MPDSPPNASQVPIPGIRIGSWLGAGLCALGLAACITIVVLGGMATMDRGGYLASGGPYEIAHPVPQGFWILPVAFVGVWVFVILHAVFASRIKGFGLAYATWCAVWTAIGATTFWYGIHPPGDDGLAWDDGVDVATTSARVTIPAAAAKFFRVTASDQVTGTGLGLSICKGIIEAHAGRIWAENMPDGLAFHFTIPLTWEGVPPPQMPADMETEE